MNWLSARLVGYGVLLGTVGVIILTSADAKEINEKRAQEKENRLIADAKDLLEAHDEKDA